MKRKIITILSILCLLTLVIGIPVFAEESSDSVVNPYSVSFKYTSDSTYHGGFTYETYSDNILNETGFKIICDLPIGHEIYDNPDTPHIDGIRINGNTVESLKFAIKDTCVDAYTVDVRLVYSEGVLGDIAKMSDGTYDWTQLLANPVMLLQLGYWALAIITVIIGLITSLFGKKAKVKTADEIATSVKDAAEVSLEKIKNSVTETVIAEFTPVFQTLLKDIENVVKAVTLSTSKSKDAPLALLDVLQDTISSNDVNSLIENVRQAILEKAERDANVHDSNAATLHAIANQESTALPVASENPNAETHPKSVF